MFIVAFFKPTLEPMRMQNLQFECRVSKPGVLFYIVKTAAAPAPAPPAGATAATTTLLISTYYFC